MTDRTNRNGRRNRIRDAAGIGDSTPKREPNVPAPAAGLAAVGIPVSNETIYNRDAGDEGGRVQLENPKLMALPAAIAWREQRRAAGQRVVLTNGVFDLLHTGHLYYLQAARRLGDVLVIALNADASVRALKGPTRPVQTEEQRAYALAALSCIDAITIFREPRLTAEIKALQPDVYCKAGDYTLDKLDGGERSALESVGAEIRFLPFLPGFSTTSLIARIKAAGEV